MSREKEGEARRGEREKEREGKDKRVRLEDRHRHCNIYPSCHDQSEAFSVLLLSYRSSLP